jgi:PhoH-like ATPase
VIFSGSFQGETLPPELQTPTVDNQILALALHEQQRDRYPVAVVTKDINLRIKAHAVGLRAEDYETDKVTKPTKSLSTSSIREPGKSISTAT